MYNMEKVKYITKKTRIVTVVINVKEEDEEYRYGISKKKNPNVHNWVAKDDDEAKELVEQLISELRRIHDYDKGAIKSKRVDGNHYRAFYGDNYDESAITWDFKITGIK